MTAKILRVPGIERLGSKALAAFWAMCQRNGWDANALAAVLSNESGFQTNAGSYAWSPKRTASGLLQFIESTAKGLGVTPTTVRPPNVKHAGGGKAWATWTILGMTHEQQLPLVEAYYKRAFAKLKPSRPVDYYLPAWGAWHGLALDHALARKGDGIYEQNSGLDRNQDGTITVQDLDAAVRGRMAQAGGKTVDVPNLPEETGAGSLLLGAVTGTLLWFGIRRFRRG